MIRSISVTNHIGETLKLELENPNLSGFSVLDVDGLEPSKAVINMTDLLLEDGSIFNSSRVERKTITLTLGINDTPNIDANRLRLYRYFPVNRQVTIHAVTDIREGMITGHVESNTPVIFSKFQTAVIKIVCESPYFRDPVPMETVFSSITPLFEFPFENLSTTQPLLNMGETYFSLEQNILYPGDPTTGLSMRMHMIGKVMIPIITKLQSGEFIKLDSFKLPFPDAVTEGFKAGDDVYISTVSGEKEVLLLRNGIVYNILNTFSRDSSWLTLDPGDNTFIYDALSGETLIQFTIENQVLYGGL